MSKTIRISRSLLSVPGSGIRDVPRQKKTGWCFRVKVKPHVGGCVDLTEICLYAACCSQIFRAEWCQHKLAKLNR